MVGLSPLARGTRSGCLCGNYYAGLSPLARGIRAKKTARFIPAGAGNTYKTRIPRLSPRRFIPWRGKSTLTAPGGAGRGLSPLARGTPYDRILKHSLRFIPAGAGNSAIKNRPIIPAGAGIGFIRWRGEQRGNSPGAGIKHVRHLARGGGLSPLARATRGGAIGAVKHGSVYPRWRGETRA